MRQHTGTSVGFDFAIAEECARWLDNGHPVAPEDPIFRSELKSNLLLTPLSRAVSNARHKDPAAQAGIGEVIELHY